jgi:hypothetical protein
MYPAEYGNLFLEYNLAVDVRLYSSGTIQVYRNFKKNEHLAPKIGSLGSVPRKENGSFLENFSHDFNLISRPFP